MCLTLPVYAQEDGLDLSVLEEEMPEAASDILGKSAAEDMDTEGMLERIGTAALSALSGTLREVCASAGIILAVVLICSLTQAADSSGRSVNYVSLAGVAAISASCITDVNSYMGQALEALETLSTYSKVLMPTLTTLSAATGAVSAGAAKCAATMIFMDVLLRLARSLVLPAVCAFASLAVVDAAVGNGALKAAAGLMKTICNWFLTLLTLAFTAWLSLVSVVSGTADAAAARMTKTAVSAALPVVGRIVADAASALAAAGATIKSTAGVLGLLVVLCVCLLPFVQLGVRYLVYKATAALCACFAQGKLSQLVDAVGSCFGMLLALTGVGAMILFISVFAFMRVVV